MFEFTVDFEDAGLNGTVTRLDRFGIRLATVAGINSAADSIRWPAVISELLNTFDNPDAVHPGCVAMPPADPDHARDPAIYVRPIQSEFLELQIDGGVRRAGDYATSRVGSIVPWPAAPTDRYGNLPSGYVSKAAAEPRTYGTKLH